LQDFSKFSEHLRTTFKFQESRNEPGVLEQLTQRKIYSSWAA